MTDDLSFLPQVEENEQQTQEELENRKKELLKIKEDCEPFKKIVESPEWEKAKKVIKEDIYLNLHYNEENARYAWGLRAGLERFEMRSKKYDEVIKELSGGDK